MRWSGYRVIVLLVPVTWTSVAGALPPAETTLLLDTRASAIHWLERAAVRQECAGGGGSCVQVVDGTWGSSSPPGVVTAEVLLALAEAGRADGRAAQRAAAWLRSRAEKSVDLRARSLRALAAGGFRVEALADEADLLVEGRAADGWGVVNGGEATSYDTALALAAIEAAGKRSEVGDVATLLSQVIASSRRREDGGWSGDAVPLADGGASDKTVSAEIVRALAPFHLDGTLGFDLSTAPSSIAYLHYEAARDALPEAAGGPTALEIASRLAALHAVSELDDDLLLLLLGRARPEGGWEDDAFVNALGLLATTTRPDVDYSTASVDVDPDLDGDGIADGNDDDTDGDGLADAADPFPWDPTNPTDTDGDGKLDRLDADDDDDGQSDLDELFAGTDPLSADTDGDGTPDGSDPCPLIAYELRADGAVWGVDDDGDGICTPLDTCDSYADSQQYADHDGDGICDAIDADADGDGFRNYVENATGGDDRHPQRSPSDLTLLEDPDGDGLKNGEEIYHPTFTLDPTLADSDSDGADDWAELGAGTDPGLASSQPPPVVAVLSNVSPAECYVGGSWVAWDPAVCGGALGPIYGAMTGGQPTPIALAGGEDPLPAGAGFENLPGFQPQVLTFDADGDGLMALLENAGRTSDSLGDTDGDGFADGHDGFLIKVAGGPEFDLDGDGTVDGELDAGTDPLDPEDHLGSAGDVAPLGHPDGVLNAGDAVVLIRMAGDPSVTAGLPDDNKRIAEQAGDVAPATAPDGVVDSADALEIFQEVMD